MPYGTTSTPFIPATAFWPRIPPCRGPAAWRALSSAGHQPRFWNNWATRSRPVGSRPAPACRCWPAAISRWQTRPRRAQLAEKLGYPIMLKAAKGGGGRGMRVVNSADELAGSLAQAQRESLRRFGSDEVFLEKFITHPRHIEVQLLGDQHGNLVHLFERDCSLQRRHQKVVELAPALKLDPKVRDAICQAALDIGNAVKYQNAGTVEFLLDTDTDKFYFIEVNPRIQVEHTVTEVVTGVDIVQCQILIAQGKRLDSPEIDLGSQAAITTRGFAIQCRVTTEDPREPLSARLRADHGLSLGRRARAFAWTAARHFPARSSRRSTIHCWSRSRPGPANFLTRPAGWNAACKNSASAA